MNVEIRYSTAEDIRLFAPRIERTSRSFTILLDGEPVAIAGVTLGNGIAEIFSDMRKLDVPKITIWKYSKIVLEKIKEWGLPVIAVASNDQMNSEKFLKSLGFTFFPEYKEQKVYKLWQIRSH